MKLHRLMLTVIVSLISVNSAEINGQSFLKTNDGRVVTCAGETVYLDINSTGAILKYASSLSTLGYMKVVQQSLRLKGNNKEVTKIGKNIQLEKTKLENSKDLLETLSSEGKILTTICDAQGNFIFKNVPKGYYSIATTVEWKVGNEKQGGFLMKSVDIKKEDEKIKVFIID